MHRRLAEPPVFGYMCLCRACGILCVYIDANPVELKEKSRFLMVHDALSEDRGKV